MSSAQNSLIALSARLAAELAPKQIESLARAIDASQNDAYPKALARILATVPQAHLRPLVSDYLNAWRAANPSISAESIVLALRSASAATTRTRSEQAVELVWTGPISSGSTMRRTDQALLEVIEGATQALLIVSFAVYKIEQVSLALMRAAARGVSLTICLEGQDTAHVSHEARAIRAFGSALAQAAAIFIWPESRRPHLASGRAVLHAKCAVADRRVLFVSSANLTDYALTQNMELGLLVRGGPVPEAVATHFSDLIARQELERVGGA